MRFRLCNSGICLALAAVGAWQISAYCQQPGEKPAVEATAQPGTNGVPAKTPQATQSRDRVESLDQALRRSFHSFSPGINSLLPQSPTLPMPPAVRFSKPRSHRKDLLSITTEEMLMPGNPDENPYRVPGAGNGLQKSTFEEIYEELTLQKPKPKKPNDLQDLTSGASQANRDASGTSDDSIVPDGVRKSEKSLRNMLNSSSIGSIFNISTGERTSLADLFKPRDTTLSPAEKAAHQEYMDRFRQILNGATAPVNPGLNPLGIANHVAASASYNNPGLPAPYTHAPLDTAPSMMDSLSHPSTAQDLSDKALNRWNSYYEPVRVDPPKPPPVAIPMSHAPLRPF